MIVPLTVRHFLDRAAAVYPERIAFVDEPEQPADSWGELTYAQMAAKARSQAATLDELGIETGARVAIMSQNSARQLVSFFGVSGWGRVLVPINFRLAPAEVTYIIEDSGAEVLLLDPDLAHMAEQVECEHIFILGRDDEQIWRSTAPPQEWDADENATATINYTSGTTARPKGVQMTHRNLWINAVTFGWHANVSDTDVYLHTLPQFHVNSWGHVFTLTGVGGKHIMLRQVDGAEILRRIDEHHVTYLCGAPAMIAMVLDAARDWEGPVPGSGRLRCIIAGAPPPTRTIMRVREDLGWEFIQIYGLTETAPLLTMSRMRAEWEEFEPQEQARLLGQAGAPVIGTALHIADGGEILVRSNTVLKGYWNNPEASDLALTDGWFHTGDGGNYEDGYLSIADRKKDVIVTGGENVSSLEVEDALALHPAVREVAVIGIPDERWGELVTAIVVTDQDVSSEDLIAHARTRLAGYKCPKRIEFREELARTATGKLQKFKLREEFWGDQDRQIN